MARALGTKQPPPSGSLSLTHAGHYGSSTWQTVHWFVTDGSDLTPDPVLDTVVDELSNIYLEELFGPFSSSEVTYETVRYIIYGDPAEPFKRKIRGADGVGHLGAGEPAQVAGLIDWSVSRFGHSGPCCTYMPGIAARLLEDESFFKSDAQEDLSEHAVNYIRRVNAVSYADIATVTFVCMSFVSGGAYRPFPQALTIYDGRVRLVPATQRRRIDRQAV